MDLVLLFAGSAGSISSPQEMYLDENPGSPTLQPYEKV